MADEDDFELQGSLEEIRCSEGEPEPSYELEKKSLDEEDVNNG